MYVYELYVVVWCSDTHNFAFPYFHSCDHITFWLNGYHSCSLFIRSQVQILVHSADTVTGFIMLFLS
jgi:hypothetical protein